METRGLLDVYCVPRDIRRHPRSWEKGREGLGVGAMIAGLPGGCGGMVYPELHSHWAEVHVSESGSRYPRKPRGMSICKLVRV